MEWLGYTTYHLAGNIAIIGFILIIVGFERYNKPKAAIVIGAVLLFIGTAASAYIAETGATILF